MIIVPLSGAEINPHHYPWSNIIFILRMISLKPGTVWLQMFVLKGKKYKSLSSFRTTKTSSLARTIYLVNDAIMILSVLWLRHCEFSGLILIAIIDYGNRHYYRQLASYHLETLSLFASWRWYGFCLSQQSQHGRFKEIEK